MNVALGQPTRGNTQRGRLSRLDAWMVDHERALLLAPHHGDVVVDVGLGALPYTTVEMAQAVHAVNPALHTVGIDNAPLRVAYAQRTATRPYLTFVDGDFDLHAEVGPVRLVRAMNLLRQYDAHLAPHIHDRLSARLGVGGLLIEGSTDRQGHILTAHLLRQTPQGLRREGLWLSTDGSLGFAPRMFKDCLPGDLRGHCGSDHPVHQMIDSWTDAWTDVRAQRAPTEAFTASVIALAQRRSDVDASRAAHGDLVWRPPNGVPHRDAIPPRDTP